MKTQRSLDSAINSGAFMVFRDDWNGLKGLDPAAIGKGVYLALSDSWDDRTEKEIGNGFLFLPKNNISEVAKREGGEVAAVYATLVKSNTVARRTYIKGNRLLAEAISRLNSAKANDEKVAGGK